jgi:hypothetical protein
LLRIAVVLEMRESLPVVGVKASDLNTRGSIRRDLDRLRLLLHERGKRRDERSTFQVEGLVVDGVGAVGAFEDLGKGAKEESSLVERADAIPPRSVKVHRATNKRQTGTNPDPNSTARPMLRGR